MDAILNFLKTTGIYLMQDWRTLLMYAIVAVLFYLAIVKKFEPLLLLPISFGMLLSNLPGAELMHTEWFTAIDGKYPDFSKILRDGGLLDILYLGVKLGVYPPLIFMGVGAMTLAR